MVLIQLKGVESIFVTQFAFWNVSLTENPRKLKKMWKKNRKFLRKKIAKNRHLFFSNFCCSNIVLWVPLDLASMFFTLKLNPLGPKYSHEVTSCRKYENCSSFTLAPESIVPTIWPRVLRYGESNGVGLMSEFQSRKPKISDGDTLKPSLKPSFQMMTCEFG